MRHVDCIAAWRRVQGSGPAAWASGHHTIPAKWAVSAVSTVSLFVLTVLTSASNSLQIWQMDTDSSRTWQVANEARSEAHKVSKSYNELSMLSTKAWKKVDNQEEADAANVEAVEVSKKYWKKKMWKTLWCPAVAGEGPQDCRQNNHCQENGHSRETDEKVIIPEQITLPNLTLSLCLCIFCLLHQDWTYKPSTWSNDKLETQPNQPSDIQCLIS